MAHPHDPSTRVCPECGARNPDGERFCASCGLVLPRQGAAVPAHAAPPRLCRREDSRFVGKSRDVLTAIRALYGVLALLSTLAALASWSAYVHSRSPGLGDFAMIVLFSTNALLTVAGFLFFHANPFVWTVVLAALQTLSLALKAMTISPWNGVTTTIVAVQGALVIALWAAVPRTARFTRILVERAHAGRASASPLATRAAAREMHDRRLAMRNFAISAGVAVGLALLAAWLPYRAAASDRAAAEDQVRQAAIDRAQRRVARDHRAGELEETAAEFRATWAKSDLDRVKAYFTPDLQDSLWPKVQKLLDKRGWREALPRLHEAEIFDHGDEGFDVFFTIDDEERLKTRWRYDASGWRISRFMFSKL